MSKFGDFLGSLGNSFQIGIGGTGTRQLLFKNAFTGAVSWNPTAARSLVLPDSSGTLALESTQGFKNKVLGSNFDTNPWQRGTSFSSNVVTYYADGWFLTTANKTFTITKTADAPTLAQAGFLVSSCLKLVYPGTPHTQVASDVVGWSHLIEGYNYAQIAQKSFALSFWVRSSKVGTYSVSGRNSGTDRSVLLEYTINVANTWELKVLTFPASASDGTWNYTNGTGLHLYFALSVGSTFRSSTIGSWQTGNYLASTNQVNWLDATNADFRLALVQCESGIATPFEQRSIQQETALCQRYYCRVVSSHRFPAGMVNQVGNSQINLPVAMRSTPTATLVSAGTRNNLGSATMIPNSNQTARLELVSTGIGDTYALEEPYAFSAEL